MGNRDKGKSPVKTFHEENQNEALLAEAYAMIREYKANISQSEAKIEELHTLYSQKLRESGEQTNELRSNYEKHYKELMLSLQEVSDQLSSASEQIHQLKLELAVANVERAHYKSSAEEYEKTFEKVIAISERKLKEESQSITSERFWKLAEEIFKRFERIRNSFFVKSAIFSFDPSEFKINMKPTNRDSGFWQELDDDIQLKGIFVKLANIYDEWAKSDFTSAEFEEPLLMLIEETKKLRGIRKPFNPAPKPNKFSKNLESRKAEIDNVYLNQFKAIAINKIRTGVFGDLRIDKNWREFKKKVVSQCLKIDQVGETILPDRKTISSRLEKMRSELIKSGTEPKPLVTEKKENGTEP